MKSSPPLPLSLLLVALLSALSATAASGQSRAVEAPSAAGPILPLEGCDDGVVKDDGAPETGYGWVPSVIEGIYVQEFEINEIAQPVVDEVCICFLRSQDDDSIDFDVVFYADNDGSPAEVPFAVFPATLDNVPMGSGNGVFATVPTPGVRLPTSGTFYVGARWDGTENRFFFICDDQSETTPFTNIWFRDDRASGWDNAAETPDSIFLAHRAMLIRIVGSDVITSDIPSLDAVGLALLSALLLVIGVVGLRSRP
ncbi:MAG: hypothetical protein AAFX50_23905 [Acidobacteriota bacterium]